MKIIEEAKVFPTDPWEGPWVGTCEKCRTKIEAGRSELTDQGPHQHQWQTVYMGGQCPRCGVYVTFSAKKPEPLGGTWGFIVVLIAMTLIGLAVNVLAWVKP